MRTMSTMVFDLRQLNSYDGSFIKVTTVNLRNKQVLEYNKKLFQYEILISLTKNRVLYFQIEKQVAKINCNFVSGFNIQYWFI